MKLENAKTTKRTKPFIETDLLGIKFKTKKRQIGNAEIEVITGIDVTIRKRSKYFPVTKDNILGTWKRVEKYFKLKF